MRVFFKHRAKQTIVNDTPVDMVANPTMACLVF